MNHTFICRNAKIPTPPEGHKWRKVCHDNTVLWLASWHENIQGGIKYVMLAATSKLKGERDFEIYETARKLKKHVDRIRREYRDDSNRSQILDALLLLKLLNWFLSPYFE
jgi:DNA topoisomerase-1